MIADGDRILLGISGGKDSLALLHILNHLRAVAPVKFELQAVTFDPGFPGFNAAGVGDYCRELGVPHRIVGLPVAEIIEEKGFDRSPCVLCSRLRRGILYRTAGEERCGKLALGQHLDDIIISFLMSLCRGQGLKTMAPRVAPERAGTPEVIRPLAFVPEEMIRRWAAGMQLPSGGSCKYRSELESGDRRYFAGVLAGLEERIPDIRSNFFHSLGKVELKHLL